MSDLLWTLAVLLFIASGVPMARWACHEDPGPLARVRERDVDRALLRLAKGEGRCPHNCITCRVLAERSQGEDR